MYKHANAQSVRHLAKATRTRSITGLALNERRLLAFMLLKTEGYPERLARFCASTPTDVLRKHGYSGKAR